MWKFRNNFHEKCFHARSQRIRYILFVFLTSKQTCKGDQQHPKKRKEQKLIIKVSDQSEKSRNYEKSLLLLASECVRLPNSDRC